ncbi:hypothetical protein DID73_00800 [Candidatus Marinamargulisbacteria bacterium SCGC AG-343-K17]|nr:hypothetical protein DID73_00800 [Candidatus Marinamargulisbacteria bacterium SCGC AG-343-K17]
MKKTLTIIGSGWLGSHFLNQYHTLFDFIVTTSLHSPAPQQSSEHYHINIYDNQIPSLPSTDICLVSIPFSRTLSDPNDYFLGIKKLIHQAPTYRTLIFTSSTSIYAPKNDWVDESSPINNTDRAKALHQTESFLLEQANNVYILRISGICGFSRNSMKKITQDAVKDSNQPVNLTHASDINQIMAHLLTRENKEKDIINVTSSTHPDRETYYRYLCQKFNLTPPIFTPSNHPFKKVSNKKLLSKYNIELMYPSPLTFEFDHD